MEIGIKIKQLRNKAGLTQEQLANKLGISAQSVSKWETSVSMPDITLLPSLAGELGVSIDELFNLTTDQKLHRLETRLDIEEEFSQSTFSDYESFLKNQLEENEDKTRILSLLAQLYHHRMEADSRRVSKYAREAIMQKPEKKGCQWLLQKAEGACVWDWNMANHTETIEFYEKVIKSDNVLPKTPMPYYEIMDNLIADHRIEEAKKYLQIYKTLPAHKPFLVPVYEAHIALAEYDPTRADEIMEEALKEFSPDGGFLFEMAQYYASKCEYEKAIEYYELSFAAEESKKPRFTDALQAIAIIHRIRGDHKKAIATYDRLIECLKDEWGYNDDDAAVADVKRQISRLIK